MLEFELLDAPRKGLFKVSRTSGAPVEGAKQYSIKIVDKRTVDDPKKIPSNNGTDGDWYERGINHRVENGCICRDVGYITKWFIEIPDIMDFVRKHGPCVVSIGPNGYETIEIYDDYRD